MNINLWEGELEVFEEDADHEYDCEIFNYCETQAGHTLIIGDDYELVKDKLGIKNTYVIKKKDA